MGCCETKRKLDSSTSTIIKNCIESNNQKLISKLCLSSKFEKNRSEILSELDKPITTINSFQLNALSYALFLGRSTIFKQLISLGCSISEMDSLLFSQNIPALSLICCKSYSELLICYLPFYVLNHSKDEPRDKSAMAEFHLTMRADCRSTYTAVQLAVQYSHINIITIIHDYFKNSQQVPFELDLNYCDEVTGENSALIACRYGNYPMIKYLHQHCKADFMALNRLGENAVQVACRGSRVYTRMMFGQVIAYLLEIIEIDVRYKYQETLLILEDKKIIAYVEQKLMVLGICAKKSEIGSIDEAVIPENLYERRGNRAFNTITAHSSSKNDSFDSSCSLSQRSLRSSVANDIQK